MIEFTVHGHRHVLPAGGHFALPRTAGYRDTPTAELRTITARIEAGQPWREAVRDAYAGSRPWLHAIITDQRRTAFFPSVLPRGDGPALDVGSGWGQIARALAACRPVVAVEPVAERMAFIRATARQEAIEHRLAFLESDYLEVDFATRFSVICAIGVLEWAGAFQSETDPRKRQQAFLKKTRDELASGGHLILGIENRLGLKYLLGCPDDHLGVPGIACHEAARAMELWHQATGRALQCFTYSRSELEQLLRDAGYRHLELFAAFPDYKLPTRIIPLRDDDAALNSFLTNETIPPEHNGYNGEPLDATFQERLAERYRELVAAGTAGEHVPSFFVRAS
jgi:hypothetical protein